MIRAKHNMNQTQKLWNIFINSPINDLEERRKCLDCFLNHCLTNDDFNLMKCPPKETLSNILSIGNILTHHFVSDVHSVCASIDSNGPNDFEAVKEYLMNDRGWKLLKVIGSFNTCKSLLYNREFANLLITLIPYLLKSLSSETYLSLENYKCDYYKNCFGPFEDITYKFNSNEMLTPAKVRLWGKSTKYGKLIKLQNRNVSDTESDDIIVNRITSKHLRVPNAQCFDPLFKQLYCNKSDCAVPLALNNCKVPIHDNPESGDIISDPSIAQLCIFMMNILSEFSRHEQLSSNNLNEMKLPPIVSLNIIESLSDVLIEIYQNTDENFLNFINEFRNLLFIACFTISAFTSGLKLIEEIKLFQKFINIIKVLNEKKRYMETLEFVCGSVYLLSGIAQNLPLTKEYAIIVRQIRIFTNYGGNDDILQIITSENQLNDDNIKSLFNAMSQLIMALQRAKILYLHRNHCTRKRHSKCDLTSMITHHCDILGPKVSHSTANKSPICCVSSITNLLLSFLLKTECRNIMQHVISALNSIAICCCNIPFMFQTLHEFIVKVNSIAIQKETFKLMERMFETQSLPFNCSLCSNEENVISYESSGNDGNDSAYYPSDTSNANKEPSRHEIGSSMYKYRTYLKSGDQQLLHTVSKHLWSLIRVSGTKLKKQLCQYVIIPSFIDKDTSQYVLELCLQILSVILNDNEISKVFVNSGGLKYLSIFITDPINSSSALTVYETLLLNESFQLNDRTEMKNFDETYPCLSSFLDIIYKKTNECINDLKSILRNKFPQSLDSSLDSNMMSEYEKEDSDYNTNKLIVQICFISNLWNINLKLINNSKNYRDHISDSDPQFTTSMYNFFLISLNVLITEVTDIQSESYKEDLYIKSHREWINTLINIIELVLPVCLHFSPFFLFSTDTLIDRNDIITSLKHHITELGFGCHDSDCNHLNPILNMLINCSLGISYYPSNTMTYLTKILMNNLISLDASSCSSTSDNDDDNDDDGNKCVESGYDADLECMVSSNKLRINRVNEHLPFIYYGELIKLVLEFITSYYRNDNHKYTYDVSCIINKLTKLCRQNTNNREVLYNNDVPIIIMNGFNEILKISKKELTDVQIALLELFIEISYYKLDSISLKLFFALFNDSAAPLNLYLNSFINLLKFDNSTPLYCLKFPCEPMLLSSSALDPSSLEMSSWIGQIRNDLISDTPKSSWEVNAIALALPNASNSLMSSNKVFSIVFWAFLERDENNRVKSFEKINSKQKVSFESSNEFESTDESSVHIFSLAFDNVTLEIWFDVSKNNFMYCLCKYVKGRNHILVKKYLTDDISNLMGFWHLFCFNIKEMNVKSPMPYISISLTIDGMEEKTITIKNGNVPKNPHSTAVLIGTTHSAKFQWKMGNFMIFRNLLSRESVLYLYCVGFDYYNFAYQNDNSGDESQRLRIPASLPHSYIKDILPLFLKLVDYDLGKTIKDGIMLLYQPQKHEQFLFYHSSNSSISSQTFNKLAYTKSSLRIMPFESYSNYLKVNDRRIIKFSQLTVEHKHGITNVIVDIGGVGAFIFMFARIMEISNDPELHEKALDILYKATHSHNQHTHIFLNEYDGLSLISYAFECREISVTPLMMKIFMKFSINQNEYDSYIISSDTISSFVSAWKVWHKNEETSKLFYDTLKSLIIESNPNNYFNIIQLRRGNVLQRLLMMLEEMFVPSDRFDYKLSVESCNILLDVITSIVGFPPEITLFHELYECTILLHKAAFAYISHSRKSFYYLFPSVWNSDIQQSLISNDDHRSDSFEIDDWEIISVNSNENVKNANDSNKETDGDDNLNVIITGVISYMGKVIRKLSDDLLYKYIGPVIQLEFLIVLANNNSCAVREEIFNTLMICLQRIKDNEMMKTFYKNKGFHLLANQLHNYSASTKLIERCFALILDASDAYNILYNDVNINCSKMEFNTLQLNSFIPLFGLLPKTLSNTSLCHNTLQLISKIIETAELSVLKSLLENGLLECTAKVIIGNNYNNLNDEYDDDLINDNIYGLIRILVRKFFGSSGAYNHQIFCNMLNFYAILEKRALSKSMAFRFCQITMFETAFEEIQKFSKNTKYSKMFLGSFAAESILSFFLLTENIGSESSMTQPSLSSIRSSPLTSNEDLSELINSNDSSLMSLLTQNEVIERFRDIILRVTEFILCRDPLYSPSEREKYFCRSILHNFSECMNMIDFQQKVRKKKSLWISILLSCRDAIRSQILRLILFLVSPLQTNDERHYISILVLSSFDFLPNLINNDANISMFLRAFLTQLMNTLRDENLTQMISLFKSLFKNTESDFKEEISDWFSTMTKTRISYDNLLNASEDRLFNRMRSLSERVTEIAMSFTRNVVEVQNVKRKAYIYELKHQKSWRYVLKREWKSIVDQFTHEKAVWHIPDAFPNSWELDPTEGPHRIRKKLKRCHLNISERFFINKNGIERNPLPLLSYLFNDDITDSSALIDRLYANEIIAYTSPCSIITPDEEFSGEILISKTCIHFVADEKKCDRRSSQSAITEMWLFEDIQEIQKRRYQLQNKAIEIFLNNGLTYLIAFDSESNREEFQKVSKQMLGREFPEWSESSNLIKINQFWRERAVTNFEYIMSLNKLSGRSFNDLMQYPVFPFVIADYISDTLNLTDSLSYRNLHKPMAVQSKHREKYYIDQYNYIKTEYERSHSAGEYIIPATTAPFHYGSHYSNSGTVLHFLVRLPPYTEMFLKYQDNNFDIPDRTFHSLATSYRLSTMESTTDFKELIPEFYFLPEFLINNEQFDFGCRQNGMRVGDVKLPNWCRNNARLFILINRQALESNYVTQHLNNWIDLIFGYKQTGKAAIESINVFHPATYYGTDVSKIDDPLKKLAMQTMIKTFGQMPKQLFTMPHPMISQDAQLPIESNEFPPVMGEVHGLKWGSYVGSPCESEPIIVWKKYYKNDISKFVALTTNDVIGLPRNSCVFMTYNRQKGVFNTSYVTSSALISWGNSEGIIRIQIDTMSVPLICGNSILDKITVCSSIPNYGVLLVGYASGSITAYFEQSFRMKKNRDKRIYLKKPSLDLHGHDSAVTTIEICKSFMIAVSGDSSGSCVVWDLNRLCYTRTIVKHNDSIELLCISETLGDIASISNRFYDQYDGSNLMVHTINGEFVGQVTTQHKITSVCYSNAPEGVSVNVIATGFINGVIKLWSSWDLSPVREIRAERFEKPIKCIAYSNDNQLLYVSYNDGNVFVWEKSGAKKNRNPSLILLHSN